MAEIVEEDKMDEKDGLPPRFGFPHEVSFNLKNSGVWTELPSGDRIWQLSIYCPEALSINLLYDQFWLPEKAKLFLYTKDREHTIGAFTSANNKGEAENIQGFATGLLYGETITLEYFVPKDVKEDGIISLARVVHGYRYINFPDNSTQSLGSSGNCQVNVNCSEGANWQQEKNAVALILIGGTRQCTGSLVNTTCNDDRPLFLTADHCLIGGDAISNPNLNNWSFYWHYERPGCPNTGAAPPILSTVGATVVANNAVSDFALLRLTEDPKNKSGVTPYYLGWDRSGSAGTGGVGIHHPRGDAKKIATYTGTPTNSTCMGSLNNNFWMTGFIATANGHSIMEPISSGSPLINSNRRIIGQLLGPGNPQLCPEHLCGNSPSLQRVSYGKFSVSWTGGGATDNRRRLDHWLNPSGGTAPTTLNGKAGMRVAGPDILCSPGSSYTLQNHPSGSTVSWSVSPATWFSGSTSGSGATASLSPKVASTGTATITYTVTTTCGPTTVKKSVWVGRPQYKMFVNGFETLTGYVYPGSNNTLNATPLGPATTFSYSDYSGSGDMSISITPTGGYAYVYVNPSSTYGHREIIVTGTNACSSYSYIITLYLSSSPLAVYPNPAQDILTLDVGALGMDNVPERIDLYSEASMKVVRSISSDEIAMKNNKNGKIEMMVGDLPRGRYYVHFIRRDASDPRSKMIRIILE